MQSIGPRGAQLARYNDLYQRRRPNKTSQGALILKDIDKLLGLKAPLKRIIQGGGDVQPPVRLEIVQRCAR